MSAASELISQYGYAAVLIGSMIEGETVAIIGGVTARHGYLLFLPTVLLATLGGMIMDQTLFFVGRRWGDTVLKRFRKHQARIEQVRGMVQRHPSAWVVGVRFAYGLRIIGPLVIGSARIPVARFILFNVMGAALWGTIMVSVGYFIGDFLQRFVAGHRHLEIGAGIAVVWALALFFVVRRFMRPHADL